MDAGRGADKWICLMSKNFNSVEADSDQSDSIKILEYPKELTLMTEYMNDVQTKQFRETNSFRSFFKKGLNLTVFQRELDAPPSLSNIIDSGIRRLPSPVSPEAA